MTNTDYIYQNQHSDFTIVERFYLKGEEQRVDDFNWRIEYFTNRLSRYVVEHKNGVFTNCIRNDDTSVLVVFDAPKFGTGHLERIIHAEYPNPLYPDGIENIEIPSRTNIEITAKASSGAGRVENQVVLDYMRGENGHSPYFDNNTQTWWQFNDETRQYEDTGIGIAGGVTRFEFESNINRIDRKNTEQDAAISELGAELIEVREIAEGAGKALVFETEQQLFDWIAGTYQRSDGLVPADLVTGQHLLIEELEVPDYWWAGAEISPLETQKVDLSDYYNKAQADARFAMKTELSALSQAVAQIQVDINGVEMIQDENLSIIG